MNETSWKKIAGVTALVVLLVALGIAYWKQWEAMRQLRKQMEALQEVVVQSKQVAQEGAKAANDAKQSAQDAATRADVAAGARAQAEEKSQQAEEQSQQAMTSAQQATEAAAKANEEVARLHRERELELNRMQEALNRVAPTKRTSQGMLIMLPDSTFRFPFDKAELSGKNKELLSRVAGILLASKGYGLSIFGYTDDVGSDQYNKQLSLQRAEAVQNYLVEAGLDRAVITNKGYGKSSPVVKGTSNEARAKNRRVEIALTDSSIKYGEEVKSAK